MIETRRASPQLKITYELYNFYESKLSALNCTKFLQPVTERYFDTSLGFSEAGVGTVWLLFYCAENKLEMTGAGL